MNQTRIGLIFRSKTTYESTDLWALEILVQTISLNVFYHFVYQLGIAYNASATYLTYRDDGIVLIDITTSAKYQGDIVNQIKALVDSSKIDDNTVKRTKQMITGQYTIDLEDVRSKTAFVSKKSFEFGKPVSSDEWINNLNQVTEEKIVKLKGEIFKQEPTLVTLPIR